MLSAGAVADAVLFALTRPANVNIDELRLSRA
jgi:NADP-dependent 3-hydroxy acid dehydrogenase YdfG